MDSAAAGRLSDGVIDYPLVMSDVSLSMVGAKFGWSAVALIAEGRRMSSDLVETFKIVNGKYDINPELFFQPDEGGRRGHDQKLFKKRFRLDVRKNVFFSNRVIDNWNMLPASCINCSTINTFKKHLSSEPESKAVKFKVCRL